MSSSYIDHFIYNSSNLIVQYLNNKAISHHKEPYDDVINTQQILKDGTNQIVGIVSNKN